MRASASLGLALATTAVSAQDAAVPASYLAGFTEVSTFGSVGGMATCVEGIVPVTATSTKNMKLNFAEPANQTAVTQDLVDMATIGMPLTKRTMGPMTTVSGTYDISAMLCYPRGEAINASTVQILTHGVGFAKSYWNFVSADYSYVDAAAEAGYATFAYDRLGVGQSAHPDPIQVVQAPLEMEILNVLATELKAGRFASTPFQHVVGVGHSFGSILTQGVTATYPKTLDAAVLTGFSTSSGGVMPFLASLDLQIASQNNPAKYFGLPNAYLIANNIIGTQFAFYHAQGFPYYNLLQGVAQSDTVTFGELLTMSSVMMTAKQFTGPIDVVDGENDLPFCQGNCNLPTNQAAAVKAALYPAASAGSQYYLAAGAGHGLNTHYSAKAAYTQIMSFVKANGF